jgi:glycosyltransferase involved in cell wall biosynthesis
VRLLAAFLFWSSIALIIYAYLGYPVFLKIVSFFRNRSVKKGDIFPKVSFVIAAYNEENRIREKIENTLAQDYPREKLETIIVSDCSTDRTDEMVRSYESKGAHLVRAPERNGKEAAQKIAVERSSGEILVFSDVATLLEANAISNIVRNFNDPTVGCVSSVDRFVDRDGKPSGEGIYVRYEMLLRSLETKVNTLVGLSGSFFAARKEVCQDWAMDLQSDFNTLLNSVKTGLRGVSDLESIGYYKNIVDEKKEFGRKVRTVLRGISVFMRGLPLLNPFKYGLFSWQLFSHKLCRWMVPFALIGAFVSNLLLTSYSVFYLWTFILQFVFYALAFGGVWMTPFSRKYFLKIPSFFVLVNLSILMAWCRYILGERLLTWEPSQR